MTRMVAISLLASSSMLLGGTMTCFTGPTPMGATPSVPCGPLTMNFQSGSGTPFGAGAASGAGDRIQLLSVTLENAGQADEFVRLELLFNAINLGFSPPLGQIASQGTMGFNFFLDGWSSGSIEMPMDLGSAGPPPPLLQVSICNSAYGVPDASWIACGGLTGMKVKPLAFATQGMCCPVDEIESVAADDSSGSSSASFRTLDMLLADAASVPPTRVGRVVTFGNGSYSVLFDLRPAVGTPEPAGWVLLTSGIALLAWRRRRLTAH